MLNEIRSYVYGHVSDYNNKTQIFYKMNNLNLRNCKIAEIRRSIFD